MKTARIGIDGQQYLICCPIGVLQEIEEHFGGQAQADDAINRSEIGDMVWLLYAMLRAGDKYAKKRGWENPPLPTMDDVAYSCDLSDFERMQGLMAKSQETEVELVPEKKLEDAPSK